jgi:hypothetical protein
LIGPEVSSVDLVHTGTLNLAELAGLGAAHDLITTRETL